MKLSRDHHQGWTPAYIYQPPLARKPIHPIKPTYFNFKDLFREFCSSTTIHGMVYIGTGKSLVVQVGWLIVCGLSMFFCGSLIRQVYDKWESSPVIVSLYDKPMPVWKIPFPAVTICPDEKVSARVMNFTKDFDEFFYGGGANMSQLRKDQLMAVMQVCGLFFHKYRIYYEKYLNDSLDVVGMLRRVMPKSIFCPIENENCSARLFTETLTEIGVCFTYNGLSSKDMFNDGVLHDEYVHLSEEKRSMNWSLEGGYKQGTPFITHPLRGVQHLSGRCNFILATEKSDIEVHCTEGKGYRMVLHSPDEYPIPFSKYVLLSLDRDIDVSITPQIMTTSKELANYSPDRRNCFFNHERKLKFFRAYNQNNCILECVTNLTLARCGCVKYSMPRSAGTRVCKTAEISCITGTHRRMLEIIMESQLKSDTSMSFCNCMSACDSIEYNSEITQSTYDYMETVDVRLKHLYSSNFTNNIRSSKVSIHFKAAEFLAMRRGELFGLTDFIANCGGILGLCLGVSFVSLVELLYYCFVRPLLLVKKSSVWVRRSRKVVEMVRVSESRSNVLH